MIAARPSRPRRGLLLATALTAVALGAACSDDEGAESGTGAATASSPSAAGTVPTSDPAAPPASVATDPVASLDEAPSSTAPSVPDPTPEDPAATSAPAGDACAALPSLELISATMGVALTTTSTLERGPGFDLCEAAGAADGVTTAQFTRLTDSSREQSIQLATELGATVVDLDDPGLPGGFAYAGAASIVIDGVEYTVQTFGMDTLGQMDSPVAVERSATLLAAWLAALGVSP